MGSQMDSAVYITVGGAAVTSPPSQTSNGVTEYPVRVWRANGAPVDDSAGYLLRTAGSNTQTPFFDFDSTGPTVLALPASDASAQAVNFNDNEAVVGNGIPPNAPQPGLDLPLASDALLWPSPTAAPVVLPRLDARYGAQTSAINDAGQVVGTAQMSDAVGLEMVAVVWVACGTGSTGYCVYELDKSLAPNTENPGFIEVFGIDCRGDILVGGGPNGFDIYDTITSSFSAPEHTYLLVPATPNPNC